MNERDRILGYEKKPCCGDEERWKGNYTHGDGERENVQCVSLQVYAIT